MRIKDAWQDIEHGKYHVIVNTEFSASSATRMPTNSFIHKLSLKRFLDEYPAYWSPVTEYAYFSQFRQYVKAWWTHGQLAVAKLSPGANSHLSLYNAK